MFLVHLDSLWNIYIPGLNGRHIKRKTFDFKTLVIPPPPFPFTVILNGERLVHWGKGEN